MTIFERIKQDHDTHRTLLNRLADTTGDSDARRDAWKEFFNDVKAHAAAEEETLYSKLIATEDGQADSRHAIHEHFVLDKIMDDLNEMDMSSPAWLNRFNTLKHDYEHHMQEEEADIFDRAKEELGKKPSSIGADTFEKRKNQELDLVDEKMDEAIQH